MVCRAIWYSIVKNVNGQHRFIQARNYLLRELDVNHLMLTIEQLLHSVKNGKGHSAIESVCGFMNLPPPMNNSAYRKIMKELYPSYKRMAQQNMKDVAASIRKAKLGADFTEEVVVDIDASFDGTWQRRGYSSLNGVVFAISKDAGQCIDYHVMSKRCSACQSWKGKEGTDEYDRFNADHNCCINYEGSAGSMGTAGVLECYRESVELNKLRYVNYIGDGDSKSYSEVVKAGPYDGMPIKKT